MLSPNKPGLLLNRRLIDELAKPDLRSIGHSVDDIAAHAVTACESLKSLPLENTTITLAQSAVAGEFSLPAQGQVTAQQNAIFKQLPAFCRVAATLKPSSDSDIKIEVWMPLANWNGKFPAVRNGGSDESITASAPIEALAAGKAH